MEPLCPQKSAPTDTRLSAAGNRTNGKKDSKQKVRNVPSGRRGFSGEQKMIFWEKEDV